MKPALYTVVILTICFCLACKDHGREKKNQKDSADTLAFFQPKTAAEFDSVIVDIFAKLGVHGSEWGTLLKHKKYERLHPQRIAIIRYIDSSIARVQHMQDVGGSEKYRALVFNMLRLQKDLLNKAYTPFDTVTNKTPEAIINPLIEKLVDMAGDEADRIQEVDKVREEYCKKNHLSCTS